MAMESSRNIEACEQRFGLQYNQYDGVDGWILGGLLTSGVPMNFLVPLIPPVSMSPSDRMPCLHALSMASWMLKIEGILFAKC